MLLANSRWFPYVAQTLRCFPFLSACLYNGKTYSHGDMWHPVLGKVLECILCTCTDGLQDCKRITCPSQYPCQHPLKSAGKCCKTCPGSQTWLITWWSVDTYTRFAVNNINLTSVTLVFSLESKAESNQTQCYHGYKNNLLVYKVESSLKVDPPNTVRIIAVERQSTAEVEVQVWKAVEGTGTIVGKYFKGILWSFGKCAKSVFGGVIDDEWWYFYVQAPA